MARHSNIVETLRCCGASVAINSLSPDRVVSLILHACDVSAPIHPLWEITYEWSERVNAEFHAQALLEVAEGLPSAPFMHSLQDVRVRARQQIMFIDYVIAPLWDAVALAFPEFAPITKPLARHRATFALIAKGGHAEEIIGTLNTDAHPMISASSAITAHNDDQLEGPSSAAPALDDTGPGSLLTVSVAHDSLSRWPPVFI